MKNKDLPTIRSTALILVLGLFSRSISAQQNIIADKDNTRPEITAQYDASPIITNLTVRKDIKYNEISWTALKEEETREYIVEFSTNGIDFSTAGEVLVNKGSYSFRHPAKDDQSLIYRIRTEQLSGRTRYTRGILVTGMGGSPVKIYPTILTGNTINVNTSLPVQRITINSTNGAQVYARNMNGQDEYFAVTLPFLSKGMYTLTFYGEEWQTTEKFIVP